MVFSPNTPPIATKAKGMFPAVSPRSSQSDGNGRVSARLFYSFFLENVIGWSNV